MLIGKKLLDNLKEDPMLKAWIEQNLIEIKNDGKIRGLKADYICMDDYDQISEDVLKVVLPPLSEEK